MALPTTPTTLTKDEFRLLTWSRSSLSRATIPPRPLQKHCPLDNGRHESRNGEDYNASTSGVLGALPIEIIHSILNLLDLQSLTDLRKISWGIQALVNTIPTYKAIVHHAPDALRALLSTKMAGYFTAQDVFNVLCTQSCFGCGNFGPFFDLFTGYRYCIVCTSRLDDLLSVNIPSAKKHLGLSAGVLGKLRTLHSLPGQYSNGQKNFKERKYLVRFVTARAAKTTMGDAMDLQQRDTHGENPFRFMSMIRVPFLNQQTGDLDWGVSCQACRLGPRDEQRGYDNWNTLYSTSSYIHHFQNCQVSQRARDVVQEYIDNPGGSHQTILDGKFLAFLSHFKY